MRKPKPPTPGSVSATLRYAGFRAIGSGSEGYEVVSLAVGDPVLAVRVTFHAYREDAATGADALVKMAATLRHKGWQVDELPGYLIVRGQLEVARA